MKNELELVWRDELGKRRSKTYTDLKEAQRALQWLIAGGIEAKLSIKKPKPDGNKK